MKIDITSMFFNSRIEGQTATPAWGTSIGQNKSRECRIDDFKQEVIDMVIGMTYKSVQDLDNLDISQGSTSRDIITCSVFNNVFINNQKIDNAQYVLLLVREHSKSHEGRLLISYAPYIKYKGIANQTCIDLMQEAIGCAPNGCWFVYDISIKNQSDLFFSAVVVDATNPVIYDNNARSRSRSEDWKGLIPTDVNVTSLSCKPLQQIFYGAPGTGKSFEINRLTKTKEVIRTTFHPDSDYSTFVGAYKPTSVEVPVRDVTGKVIIENGQKVTENRIVYEFVEQAFLQAYIKAWKAYADIDAGETPEEQYLVIEEINRGNCAQIFGDLFQLLDRNKAGFSDYPITADKDMKKQLAKAFKDMTIADAARINSCYDKDIVSKVLSGDILLLPDNLYIWATMNTSDQSLFPIDSAFKRRWDWKYVPISEGVTETGTRLGYKLKVSGKLYDWWSFINKINNEIGELTKSEDKKLGYFFCKANGETIDAETFVSKVVFYLWNDVFKDQDVASIFNDGDEELTFSMFYDTDIYGKAIVKEDKVEVLLKNLGLEPIPATEEPSVEEMAKDDNTPLTVTLNGEVINEGTSSNTFVKVLQKIGLERLADKNIAGSVLVSKSGEESRVWRKVDDYFVYIGWWANYKKNWLQSMSKELGIDLTVK